MKVGGASGSVCRGGGGALPFSLKEFLINDDEELQLEVHQTCISLGWSVGL